MQYKVDFLLAIDWCQTFLLAYVAARVNESFVWYSRSYIVVYREIYDCMLTSNECVHIAHHSTDPTDAKCDACVECVRCFYLKINLFVERKHFMPSSRISVARERSFVRSCSAKHFSYLAFFATFRTASADAHAKHETHKHEPRCSSSYERSSRLEMSYAAAFACARCGARCASAFRERENTLPSLNGKMYTYTWGRCT